MGRDEVLGTWELVSYTVRHGLSGAVIHPLSPDATGLLIYTADGYMSVQLMRPGRPEFDQPDTDGGTTEQAAAAAMGYLAYGGPFEVDEHTGVLRHEVNVSLLPNWLNQTQLRNGALDGNHLTLTGTSTSNDDTTTAATLVWRRAQEHPSRSR
jgi:lipocalin-like protein